MLAQQLRSGLVETIHDGAVAVVGPDGSLLASSGDIDRTFYIRSSAKPFQATIAQEAGASFSPLEMALACASHRGYPVHRAMAAAMLGVAGLDEGALGCPRAWPLAERALHQVVRDGHTEPRRIWHNCSGKHAGFLRACVAAGWDTGSYLDPDHPLQRHIVDFISQLGEYQAEPAGVDGCGAPVMRTTARSMALMFSRLATEDRLASAFSAMHRYPALVGGNGEGDTEIAMAIDGVAKGGAAGCVGVATGQGHGIAVKSWDGSGQIANLGAVSALMQLGVLSATATSALEPVLSPPVYGGGQPVGRYESLLELEFE